MPPSTLARGKGSAIDVAASLYERFTGHHADDISQFQIEPISVGVPVGYLDGVLYTTIRDGQTEKYIHRFKRKSRPLLIASHDGKQLGIVGGRFQFDERGIEDR